VVIPVALGKNRKTGRESIRDNFRISPHVHFPDSASISQFPLDLFEDVRHRHDALAELKRDVIGQPLPHSLFARHDRTVIAIAEVPADLAVGRTGVRFNPPPATAPEAD
jgi:hypothetical protein